MAEKEEHLPNILVIACWHDAGNFRARVTCTDRRDAKRKSSVVVDTRADALQLVSAWIASVAPDTESPG